MFSEIRQFHKGLILKKKKTEKQVEAKKRGAERMRQFEIKQEKKLKKKEAPPTTDMLCVEYFEKDERNGDYDWSRKMYYYNKKIKKEKFDV